jgi:hypothetical protein
MTIMRRMLTTIACSVLLAGGLTAQAKPNFAGSWKPTTAPAADDMFASSALSATQDDKTFTTTATGQMGDIKTVYNLDGTEAKSPLDMNGMTIDRTTTLAWDGPKLVLTSKSDFNGQAFEVKQVWSLADDGTLTVETTRPDMQGGGGPVTTKTVYKH